MKERSAYKLTAVPFLFLEGQFAGKMRNVTFVARSSGDTRRWFTVNYGHFERAFKKIVSAMDAMNIVAALVRGEDVEFPGYFVKKQFECHFVYQASGIY